MLTLDYASPRDKSEEGLLAEENNWLAGRRRNARTGLGRRHGEQMTGDVAFAAADQSGSVSDRGLTTATASQRATSLKSFMNYRRINRYCSGVSATTTVTSWHRLRSPFPPSFTLIGNALLSTLPVLFTYWYWGFLGTIIWWDDNNGATRSWSPDYYEGSLA